MRRDVDFRKWVVAALLVFHIAWIANHMRWVATGQINPWKLGGYAMYTIPAPSSRVLVFDAAMQETPTPVNLLRYVAAQRFSNPARVFRCAHMSAQALQALIYENRNLIGRNIMLVIAESQFVRNPPSISRRVTGIVTVTWEDMKTFTFVSKFCGTEHVETAKWQE
jgi:hypothetical protein